MLARPLAPFVLLALASGCAAHSAAIEGPGRGTGDGYEWPPRSSYGSSAPAEEEPPAPRRRVGTTRLTIPARAEPAEPSRGVASAPAHPKPTAAPTMAPEACLAELSARGVSYRRLEELRGVEVPLEVTGKLGGVEFWTDGGRRLEMDCRLALALDRLGFVFRRHGVTRVRYSGAYVYKRTASGRLSHHAHGLAIDVHAVTLGSGAEEVTDDYVRGVGCGAGGSPLNALTCDLSATAVFDELLTPDYDGAHYDHVHLSIPRR